MLDVAQAGPLRSDISTDEISPLPAMVHFDAELGRHAHTGFTAGGQRPIGVDALRHAGVSEQMSYVSSAGGAFLALNDRSLLTEMKTACAKMEFIELNLQPGFEDAYIDHLALP